MTEGPQTAMKFMTPKMKKVYQPTLRCCHLLLSTSGVAFI